jgi:hypothetical protein
MSVVIPSLRAAVAVPGWAKDALWRRAQAVPSLDLRFADNKSLVDAVTGASLVTFTRASSGTFTDSAGVLRTATTNEPRFDHNPTTGESLGLLVEEARTNLALYSQAINLANWGSQQATIQTLNAATSPDGSSNATLFVENTQNANRFIGQTIGVTNTAYTVSIFAKAKERRRIMFRESTVSGTSATFDLQSGTVAGSEGSPTTSIQPYGNGWYRCVMIYTPSSTSTRLHSVYLMPDSGTSFATSTYAGDGVSGLYLFGFQVELGAFPTSYIPTTTAAATRAADVVSITGSNFSSWYNQTEGTVFGVATINGIAAQNYIAAIDAGAGFADSHLYYAVTGTPRFETFVASTNQSQLIPAPATALTAGSQFAMGYAFKQNDFAASRNGGSVATDVSGNVPTTNRLAIGSSGSGFQLNGTIRRLVFWPQALPSRLQSITQ